MKKKEYKEILKCIEDRIEYCKKNELFDEAIKLIEIQLKFYRFLVNLNENTEGDICKKTFRFKLVSDEDINSATRVYQEYTKKFLMAAFDLEDDVEVISSFPRFALNEDLFVSEEFIAFMNVLLKNHEAYVRKKIKKKNGGEKESVYRKRGGREHKKWLKEEELALKVYWTNGKSLTNICSLMGRTPASVLKRLRFLKLIDFKLLKATSSFYCENTGRKGHLIKKGVLYVETQNEKRFCFECAHEEGIFDKKSKKNGK